MADKILLPEEIRINSSSFFFFEQQNITSKYSLRIALLQIPDLSCFIEREISWHFLELLFCSDLVGFVKLET